MDLRQRGFQLPDNISFDPESLTGTYGRLHAEAFQRGFGTTIGNALRRILLSSIEGAAVTAVRIPGVLHEFSTLSGVKEDVVDVLLNVKQLRFKLHTDEPQVLTLEVKGPAEVKAKDINTGAHAEILNPDQHIATLEKNIKFSMELTVRKGKGYVTADRNMEEDQPVDTMAVDSIFTPIKKVNYWVEGARVGRSTDYDKLILEVWTDGSISPQSAVSEAADVLKEHLALFSMDGSSEEEEPGETEAAPGIEKPPVEIEEENQEPAVVNDHLLKNVDELELSVRSYNCLKNANIRTIADLVQKTEQEMLRTKNFGRKSLNEIKEIIETMGLHFNMRVDQDELQKLAEEKRTESAT